MKIFFYYVKEEYINYLKTIEIDFRGFTTVPNVSYANTEKFLFGTVLEINDVSYFVPVSSYSKNKEDNFLIRVKSGTDIKIVGSLRFNYMIPVPTKCLIPVDFNNLEHSYRALVQKELNFCKKNRSIIQQKAVKTYSKVINNANEILCKNSCDFKLLERACKEYEQ